jgi:hypothetical protein
MLGDIAEMTLATEMMQARFMEEERKMFELSIVDLPAEEKAVAREKRRLEQREDRKRRELCQAIRDSKPGLSWLDVWWLFNDKYDKQ